MGGLDKRICEVLTETVTVDDLIIHIRKLIGEITKEFPKRHWTIRTDRAPRRLDISMMLQLIREREEWFEKWLKT